MKSPVKTAFHALLVASLFLPVYYSFAATPLDDIELNNGSHSNLNIHDDKSPACESNEYKDADLTVMYSTDIKDLFTWSGWSFNAILDNNEDGVIDSKDIPIAYDLIENKGNGDGIIDDNEFNNWLSDAEYVGLATYHENERIIDIPEIILSGQAAASAAEI